MKHFIAFAAVCLCPLATAYATGWNLTPGASVSFSTRAVSGTMKGLSGTIEFDPANPAASRFDVTLNPATINTGNATRDEHARGEDWLNVVAYPTIRFTSTGVARAATGYVAKGFLQMHGVKKEVTLPFTFSGSGSSGLFSGTLQLSRADYGVKGPGMRGKIVGGDISIEISAPVTAAQ